MADNNKVLLPVFPNARSVALPSLKMSISVVNEYGKRLSMLKILNYLQLKRQVQFAN